MACMEHMCIHCGHLEFNNISRMAVFCPKCKGAKWISICDEDIPQAEDIEDDSAGDDNND